MQTRLAKWETKRKGWDKWSNNGLLTKKRERREIWTNREVVNFCPADRASSTRERKEKKGKKKKLRSVEVRVCVCVTKRFVRLRTLMQRNAFVSSHLDLASRRWRCALREESEHVASCKSACTLNRRGKLDTHPMRSSRLSNNRLASFVGERESNARRNCTLTKI